MIKELAEKSIVIVGLGREGLSTYHYLRQEFPEKVLVLADRMTEETLSEALKYIKAQDQHVVWHLGQSYRDYLNHYDVVIKSAGIPLKDLKPLIDRTKITSATALFFAACPAPIIGITGTKGKSTTTTVIYQVLKQSGQNAILCGNIGIPALDLLTDISSDSIVVMELSSHQLQGLQVSPHIAVLQNIVPEHLDYYENFEDYIAAKATITQFQSEDDYFLYNAAYEIPNHIASQTKAHRLPFNKKIGAWSCYEENGIIFLQTPEQTSAVLKTDELQLVGQVNWQNVMPAISIGALYKIPPEQIKQAIISCIGLEDRLQFVGEVNGVKYYNDSLATVPEATIAALEAFDGQVSTLLAGGFDRGGMSYEDLAQKIINSSIQILILFPETGQKIWQTLEAKQSKYTCEHFFVESMAEAVAIAKQHTPAGTICLLSPAAPSFGMFKDYHDRGTQFTEYVLKE